MRPHGTVARTNTASQCRPVAHSIWHDETCLPSHGAAAAVTVPARLVAAEAPPHRDGSAHAAQASTRARAPASSDARPCPFTPDSTAHERLHSPFLADVAATAFTVATTRPRPWALGSPRPASGTTARSRTRARTARRQPVLPCRRRTSRARTQRRVSPATDPCLLCSAHSPSPCHARTLGGRVPACVACILPARPPPPSTPLGMFWPSAEHLAGAAPLPFHPVRRQESNASLWAL